MKRLPLKYLPLTGVFLLFLIIGFFLITSDKKDIAEAILEEIIPEEGLISKNIKVSQNDPDEGATWVLEADEFKYSKGGQKIQFNRFNIKIEPENNHLIELEGNKGEYNKDTHEINLYGEVKGLTGTGYEIHTEHILFKQKEDRITSDEKIELVGPYIKLSGKGLYIDFRSETLKILNDVNSKIKKESLIL